MRNFDLDWPVFIWMAVIGLIVCFAFGFGHSVKSKGEQSDTYGYVIASLIVSAGFGVGTVMTCLRYSVTIPNFFLWKIGLFILSVAAMFLLSMLFWGVIYTTSLLSLSNDGEEERRKHHKTR